MYPILYPPFLLSEPAINVYLIPIKSEYYFGAWSFNNLQEGLNISWFKIAILIQHSDEENFAYMLMYGQNLNYLPIKPYKT